MFGKANDNLGENLKNISKACGSLEKHMLKSVWK
jgi:hypothetical protein